jgi:uncharacterized protein
MSSQMPQEIEVWYVLPAIRKELAKSMVEDYKLSQKEVAGILGITEAAVSQYRKSRRATGVEFNPGTLEEIKKAAGRVIRDSSLVRKEIYNLCSMVKVTKQLCELHMHHDKSVPEGCDICLK